MLLDAARGDREARNQAVATMPLWWAQMPQGIRNNIDFRVDAWRRDHSRTTDRPFALRKLDMLLPHFRDHRCGAQRLGAAARLPV
ncbi:MAG: hypothetical protein WBE26_02590 [Phycisphaerae bacterium]